MKSKRQPPQKVTVTIEGGPALEGYLKELTHRSKLKKPYWEVKLVTEEARKTA